MKAYPVYKFWNETFLPCPKSTLNPALILHTLKYVCTVKVKLPLPVNLRNWYVLQTENIYFKVKTIITLFEKSNEQII